VVVREVLCFDCLSRPLVMMGKLLRAEVVQIIQIGLGVCWFNDAHVHCR
jgi:hypothetical protein